MTKPGIRTVVLWTCSVRTNPDALGIIRKIKKGNRELDGLLVFSPSTIHRPYLKSLYLRIFHFYIDKKISRNITKL